MTRDDLNSIEQAYAKMTQPPPTIDGDDTVHTQLSPSDLEEYQQSRVKPYIFNKVMGRIDKVLRYNYMTDFNRLQIQQVTFQATAHNMPRLGFNCLQSAK